MNTLRATTTRLAFALLASMASLNAQADYFESFDSAGFISGGNHGPSGLLASGWEFRNQSDPVSSGDWTAWNYSFQGTKALNVNQTVGQWFNFNDAAASSWAILPTIPGQAAGDELRFMGSSVIPSGALPSSHFEVRYSPSGNTGTGSDADDVGAFTTLLGSFPDPQTHLWSEFVVSVPGNGRLAFRFVIPPAATQSDFSGSFQIDNLSIGAPSAGPPLPETGETVTWTTAMSPVTISEITTIVAGGTVVVQPGVVVELAPTATLTLFGNMLAVGQPGLPVTLQGDEIEVFGNLQLEQAIVTSRLTAYGPGSLTCRDVEFLPGSSVWTGGSVSSPPFLDIDACAFDDAIFWVGSCALRLTNSSFSNSFVSVGGSNPYLDNLSFDGASQSGLALQFSLQPLWLDNVSITNSAEAGLDLAAVNLMLGSDVTLQGNLYPARLGGSGFLDGSTLPATGNVNDHVHVEVNATGLAAGNTWADVGIPYAIPDFYSTGRLDILPGVRIKLGPAAEFWGAAGPVEARGTPTNPVVFERLDPGAKWQGLQKLHRYENCVIDGGEVGARFNSASFPGFIDNCVIRNCDFGMQNDAIIRKTRFIGNGVGSWGDNVNGALDGATGGNAFEGNAIAVQDDTFTVDAPRNWWGDPTGPSSPDNPGGQGQSTLGSVVTVPFLTSPPDFGDDPPIVHLQRNADILEPNSKVILNWSSTDDVGVVRHRIEFDHPLDAGAITVVADDLPPTQRAYEWTIPDIGFAVNGKLPRIRVVAVDTAGQEGWDASDHVIPSGEVGGTLTIQSDLTGPFMAGTPAGPLCWDASGLTGPIGAFEVSVVSDADHVAQTLGSTFSTCLPGAGMGIPFLSTDTARVRIVVQGTTNRSKTFYSAPFTIRPDTRIGDDPPSVTMLSPLDGAQYVGGEIVPITWTATDDEAVRGFSIQASYDAGHTWHVLAHDLPAMATSFDWQLPPTVAISDARVRVIAVDRRFQNSSDGADHVLVLQEGPLPVCQTSLGSSGPGKAVMSLCGDALATGGSADLVLQGAPGNALAFLVVSTVAAPAPFKGGMLVPAPDVVLSFITDPGGSILVTDVPGGGGPLDVYAQFVVQDIPQPAGFALSNALRVSFLP